MFFDAKKAGALFMSAAMLSSLAGCGATSRTGGTADGQDIPAGIYIYFLQSAYYDAKSKIDEQNAPAVEGDAPAETVQTSSKEFYAQSIDGKSVKQWVIDEAVRQMREYAVVEKKFGENSLELTEAELTAAQSYMDYMWEYGGEYLSSLGISQDSYKSVYLNDEKRSKLFEKIYGEGGEKAVPESEIKQYMLDNYVRFDYIDMELKDGEGNLLKSEGKSEIMAMAEDYAQRYKNGEDFTKLAIEYDDYHKALVAEAEAKAAEEAALTAAETAPAEGSVLDEQDGLQLVEVPEESAQDEPAAETTVSVETEAPVEEPASETQVAETAAETAETSVQAEEAPAAEETAAVTAATEAETIEETTAASAADAAAGEPQTTEELLSAHPDFASNDQVIDRKTTYPSEAVVKAVFDEMKVGDTKIIESEDSEHYYLVVKLDIEEKEDYFQSAKSSLLFEMKEEEYDKLVESWLSEQNFVTNQASVRRYDPTKLFKD
ncbi:MAG: hypothetical protein J6F31_09570 [Oscillospiraceae bacterium]|nr:hypothetical protein [Oscillospiraceae bacterium]